MSGRLRHYDVFGDLSRRRMIDLRQFSFQHQTSMRLQPVGKLRTVLTPMDIRGLIAPPKQLWHDASMWALLAKATHRFFVFPRSESPKNVLCFTQDSTAEKVRTVSRLACDLKCLPE